MDINSNSNSESESDDDGTVEGQVAVEEDEEEAAEEEEEEEEVVVVVEEEEEGEGENEEDADEEVGQTGAAGAAVRQAEAEGLTLQPREDNATGYRGVNRTKPGCYQARVWRAGKYVHLGSFATAEEAALAYARTPEGKAEAKAQATKPAPLTAGEAVAQAAAEGLKLEPNNNAASGFKGVTPHSGSSGLNQAYVRRAGKKVHIGSFATAEEAALAVARADADARTNPSAVSQRPAGAAAAKRAAPPAKPPPAKQPRNSLAPHHLQPVAHVSHATLAPQAPMAAAAAAAPAPTLFKDKLALLKRELGIEPLSPAIPAVAEANELLGITPSGGDSLCAQLDTALAAVISNALV